VCETAENKCYIRDICVTNINMVKFKGLSEHKHCNKAATNANSENTRSRIGASSVGKGEYGENEDESSNRHIWAAGFHNVKACSRLARALKLMNYLLL
jgi:hypothetical protein